MVDDFTTDWFFWHLADLLWSWSSSKQGCCKKGRVLQSNLGHFSSESGVPFIARFYTCGSNKLKLLWEKLVDRQSCKLPLVQCSQGFYFYFIFILFFCWGSKKIAKKIPHKHNSNHINNRNNKFPMFSSFLSKKEQSFPERKYTGAQTLS
jgi:hypothetical protein